MSYEGEHCFGLFRVVDRGFKVSASFVDVYSSAKKKFEGYDTVIEPQEDVDVSGLLGGANWD